MWQWWHLWCWSWSATSACLLWCWCRYEACSLVKKQATAAECCMKCVWWPVSPFCWVSPGCWLSSPGARCESLFSTSSHSSILFKVSHKTRHLWAAQEKDPDNAEFVSVSKDPYIIFLTPLRFFSTDMLLYNKILSCFHQSYPLHFCFRLFYISVPLPDERECT